MVKKTHVTDCGTIHYWVSEKINDYQATLIFLPGLTADHRLFDKQIVYFDQKYQVFVWDAPGHVASWPFTFEFSLLDKAQWLGYRTAGISSAS